MTVGKKDQVELEGFFRDQFPEFTAIGARINQGAIFFRLDHPAIGLPEADDILFNFERGVQRVQSIRITIVSPALSERGDLMLFHSITSAGVTEYF